MAGYKAKRGNMQISLDNESQANSYQAQGYDIYLDGAIVQYGTGKTVPYAKYHALEVALAGAKAKLELLEDDGEGIE